MSERPRVCRCVAKGLETCACDVPFIGNFAEADRRIADGTLLSLNLDDVKEAVRADVIANVERLIPPHPEFAEVTIIVSGDITKE